jgi:hypothetical protein
MASVAVRVRQLTAQPNWSFVSSNSTSINPTTPEITEASNPIRKPPRATINAIVKEYLFALFIRCGY